MSTNDESHEGRFEVLRTESDGSVVLNVSGQLDVDTSPQLKKTMDECFAKGVDRLNVALDRVPRIDSSGIATLVEGLKWSRSSGKRFTLSGLQGEVLDLIRLSNLEHEFEIEAKEK